MLLCVSEGVYMTTSHHVTTMSFTTLSQGQLNCMEMLLFSSLIGVIHQLQEMASFVFPAVFNWVFL